LPVAEDADYQVRALVHSEKSKKKLLEAYPKLSAENIVVADIRRLVRLIFDIYIYQ
jgi:SepF-like predicted cell division protein (DUF552 family)